MAGRNATKVISLINNNANLGISPRHLVFIVGIYSNITGTAFKVDVISAGANPNSATVQVSTGATTTLSNITITSVIYNAQNSQLLSHSGITTYTAFSQQ